MAGQSESEQLQNFYERLGHWVSKQGFWFQLRYSLSNGHGGGAFGYHVAKLFVRVALFLVLIGFGIWFFLFTQFGSERFKSKLTDDFHSGFAADEIEIAGINHKQGKFSISRLAMIGGEETFFTKLQVKNLNCQMNMLDQFRSSWNPGLIEISEASVSLKAGADSVSSAKAIADILFQEGGYAKFDTVVVKKISLNWGYSTQTRGRIYGSRMSALRLEDGWRLNFKGGYFSQNWLKKLQIKELQVAISQKGLVFEKALFAKGKASISLLDVKIKAGMQPEITGQMSMRDVSLSSLLPDAVEKYVEGEISGEFTIFGSTNSAGGVGFEGDVNLVDDDTVQLRDQLPLLKSLSVVDAYNNYRRVIFDEGGFHLKTYDGKVVASNLHLKADELLGLNGQMTVALPTASDPFTKSKGFDALTSELELKAGTYNFNLQDPGNGENTASKMSVFNRIDQDNELQVMRDKQIEAENSQYSYKGEFTVSLARNAFDRAPKLLKLYPVSDSSGRIEIDVPIQGKLEEITVEKANDFYKNGAR